MTWARLDDQFTDHPKVVEAGPMAGWLYVCGLTYANRYLTDGFIPGAQVKRLADLPNCDELADRLVSVGLWDAVDGGYRIHDFLDYNRSAADVKAERDEAARRQSEWRARKAERQAEEQSRNGVTNAVTDAVSHGKRLPAPDPVPDRTPVLSEKERTTRPESEAGARTREVSAADAAPPPQKVPVKAILSKAKTPPVSFGPLIDSFRSLGLDDPPLEDVDEKRAAQALLKRAPPERLAGCWQEIAAGEYLNEDVWAQQNLSFSMLLKRNRFSNWMAQKDGKYAAPTGRTNGRSGISSPHPSSGAPNPFAKYG